MKKVRKLASTSLSCLFFGLFPTISQALGLGDIHLHSHLNEVLDAEISLEDIKGVNPDDIITSLADDAAFTKAGIDPTPWINRIQFQVITLPHGKFKIKLSTQEPVKEPYADLLIQVIWPNGKIVREYTLLLDPPKASTNPLTVALAKVAPEKFLIPVTSQGGGQDARLSLGGKYGPVNDQALWNIARKLVKNTSFTVRQGVIAIADKNPRAFVNGNIHHIKKGAVLDLPTQQELSQYSEDLAIQFLQSHTQTKSSSTQSSQQNTNIAVQEPSKPLTLVAPITYPQDKMDSQRLSLIEEAIDTLKRSNEDISQKNQHLQTQNESLAKLLALRETELNGLKQTVEQKTSLTEAPPSVEVATLHTLNSYQRSKEEVFSESSSDNMPEPSQAHLAKAGPSHEKQGPVASDHIVSEPIVRKEQSNTQAGENAHVEQPKLKSSRGSVYLLFVFVFCCSLLGWLWYTRHHIISVFYNVKRVFSGAYRVNSKQKQTASAHEPPLGNTLADAQVNFGLQFDLEKSLDALTNEESKFHKHQGASLNERTKQEQDNFHKKSMASLEDAEIYIAYERYQQAEKILVDILQNEIGTHEPIYWEGLLKLLELYVLTEKYDEYEKWYQKIPSDLKEISPKVWSKITLLQERVESNKSVPLSFQTMLPPGISDNVVDSVSAQETTQSSAIASSNKFSLDNDQDEVHPQISLAKAYMDVGDLEAARDLLIQILPECNPKQQEAVQLLLVQLSK